jgi:cobalt-zinc-cadmium efflux system protein
MEHHHNHAPKPITNLNKAFIIGIVLNLTYVLIQIGVGLQIKSLSLLSDAGHNFLDVAGLALSLLAFKLSKIKYTERYTYGYRKASILISLLNAVVLLISIGAIGYESFFRFYNPQPLSGRIISIIAALGILINGGSALFFWRDKDKDINVKSAFLHLASDALVSVGLVIGGIIIHFTHIYWLDPLLSILICLVIIASTWSLLKDSLRLSLDGVPENIDIKQIKNKILSLPHISDFHHIHVWALSTSQNALTGHLVIKDIVDLTEISKIKDNVKHELEHFNIQHATIEVDNVRKLSDEEEGHDKHDPD